MQQSFYSANSIARLALLPSPPECSPKSMYRLADEVGLSIYTFGTPGNLNLSQLGLTELKKLAMEDIKTKLSSDNILVELFSTFTWR